MGVLYEIRNKNEDKIIVIMGRTDRNQVYKPGVLHGNSKLLRFQLHVNEVAWSNLAKYQGLGPVNYEYEIRREQPGLDQITCSIQGGR